MKRKICPIGNSQGVSIPKEMLDKLRLHVGDGVDVEVNEKSKKITIGPMERKPRGIIDREFAGQVDDFIKKYKPALKALAK